MKLTIPVISNYNYLKQKKEAPSLEQVLELERAYNSDIVKETMSLNEFKFELKDGKPYFLKGTEEFTLGPAAVKKLLSLTGIGERAARRLPDDQLIRPVQYLIEQLASYDKGHTLLFRDKQIVAINGKNSLYYSNSDMIEALLKSLPSDAVVRKYRKDDLSTIIQVGLSEHGYTLNGKSAEKAFVFGNSETGFRSFSGKTFIFILKCTNGLMDKSPETSFSFDHNILHKYTPSQEIYDLMDRSHDKWDSLAKLYEESKNIAIKDPSKFLEISGKHYHIGKTVVEKIESVWENSYDSVPNLMSIVDAYTQYAHEGYDIGSQQNKKLELAGSSLLHEYPVVFQKISEDLKKNPPSEDANFGFTFN